MPDAGVSKRPIVASAFENTREFLDETNGWSIKYDDVEKWAKTCDEILRNGTETALKIQNNYIRSIATNSIETLKNEIGNLLTALETL